ncbi:hypothetical protein ASD88_19045 [Pelomonas sp. Root662]|nr:hypothetical protein ASC81_14885 [Pelomonas sp. Root405]KRA70208.1 hypothetical protein ASD88_19045 [Pelomonas sp. Root662]
MIALPGTLLDSRSLALMLSGLSAKTLVLGEADGLDDEADRLAAQAHAPAIWVGHSLGGIVALHLARRHPGRVAALVLLASNARAGRDTPEARRAAHWELAQRHGLARLARDELAPAYGLVPGDAMVASLAEQAECVGLARFRRQLSYARERPGLLAPPHWLTCPVLALSGERDGLCPPGHSCELIALVQPPACGEHHMLADAGHLFPMQQAPLAALVLHRFLTSLGQGVI